MRRDRRVGAHRRGWIWRFSIGLGLVGVAVCTLLFLRCRFLHQERGREVERYLSEVSQQAAETMNSRVDASFQALETTAAAYSGMSGPAGVTYLNIVTEQYGFLRMGVSTLTGPIRTTDGLSIPLEGLAVAQDILAGAERATGLLESSQQEGEAMVVYGVPLRVEGQITGVLVAVNSRESLRDYLAVDSFGGEGYSFLMNGRGDLVANSPNPKATSGIENIFSVVESGVVGEGYSVNTMRADMAARRAGQLGFTPAGQESQVLSYVPLQIADWYFLSVVPDDVAGEGAGHYLLVAALTDGATLLLFLALIAAVGVVSWKGEHRAEELAFVDPITGGRNRAAFERDATALLRRVRPGEYALVSADLQDFKLVNESLGSAAGDRTLAHIYRVLAEHLEENEIMGRVRDDVFHMVLHYTGRAAMQQRMADLNEEVNRSYHENQSSGGRYRLPLVQGVCVVDDTDLDLITLQDRANEARKNSKRPGEGGGACSFYDELFREKLRREKEISNRMEDALDQREFIIYFQPKVELKENIVIGAEALIRWKDPRRGLISPGEFIPLFERNGFITKLDRYVFEQVCILQRRWLDAGYRPMPLSVNLSRRNVENPDFLDDYIRIRDRYQIPDGLLELEITESFFLENGQGLLSLIKRIRQEGFLCSLDDFGSGYSSLSLLRVVPVDIIKLDRVFFTDTEYSQRSEYVVQSVLELAHRLRIKTVCEGVEEPLYLRALRRFQCDAIQGFIFSPPVPIDQFERLAFPGVPLVPGKGQGHST